MSSVQEASDGIDFFDGLVSKVAGDSAHEIFLVCLRLDLNLVYSGIFPQMGHVKGIKVNLQRGH